MQNVQSENQGQAKIFLPVSNTCMDGCLRLMRGPDVASDPTEPMFATPDFSKTTHFARKKGLSDTLTVILFFCFGVVRFSRTCQLRENLVRFREEKKIFFRFLHFLVQELNHGSSTRLSLLQPLLDQLGLVALTSYGAGMQSSFIEPSIFNRINQRMFLGPIVKITFSVAAHRIEIEDT